MIKRFDKDPRDRKNGEWVEDREAECEGSRNGRRIRLKTRFYRPSGLEISEMVAVERDSSRQPMERWIFQAKPRTTLLSIRWNIARSDPAGR